MIGSSCAVTLPLIVAVVTCALIVTAINNITSTKKDRILFNINVVD